jgi:uncharacterized MAPEG superfamily protein
MPLRTACSVLDAVNNSNTSNNNASCNSKDNYNVVVAVAVIMFKEEMINEHFRWGRWACVFDMLIFYLLHLHSNELLRAQIFNICLLTI